jgi:hypothetical protein
MPLKAALAAALFVAIVAGLSLPARHPQAAPKSQIAQIELGAH